MFTKKKINDLISSIESYVTSTSKAIESYGDAVNTLTRNVNKLTSVIADNTANIDANNAKIRLAALQSIAGTTSIENKMQESENYEFALRIIQKQLSDQLIYIGGGDESLVSTRKFESVKDCCETTLALINCTLENTPRMERRK